MAEAAAHFEYQADLRYVGQEHAIVIIVQHAAQMTSDFAPLVAAFNAEHARRYGQSAVDEILEVVKIRLVVEVLRESRFAENWLTEAWVPQAHVEDQAREVVFDNAEMPQAARIVWRPSRCLARHGISRLPEVQGDTPAKKRFKAYPIGYLHIDIAEVQTAEGKLYLYVAIDRASKFTVVQLVKKAGRTSASAFLERVIEAFPGKIHIILTDNSIQFTFAPRYANGPTARYMFDMRCRENGIEHRLTKVKHPWTNGQVERMSRTIKEATVKRYHYDSHQQLDAHPSVFIDAYNYGRRLKTLQGLTPYEFICKIWTKEPERFRLNPIHQSPGLNS